MLIILIVIIEVAFSYFFSKQGLGNECFSPRQAVNKAHCLADKPLLTLLCAQRAQGSGFWLADHSGTTRTVSLFLETGRKQSRLETERV